MLFNYQSSCIAHQATCLFYQMSKCLSTTFLFFLISYFQTAYESVLFRVVPADSLYIISPLPLSVNNFFTIISYLMNLFFTTLFYNNQLFIMSNVKRLIFFHFEKKISLMLYDSVLFCNCSEPSKISKNRYKMLAFLKLFLKFYLADTPHRRNA